MTEEQVINGSVPHTLLAPFTNFLVVILDPFPSPDDATGVLLDEAAVGLVSVMFLLHCAEVHKVSRYSQHLHRSETLAGLWAFLLLQVDDLHPRRLVTVDKSSDTSFLRQRHVQVRQRKGSSDDDNSLYRSGGIARASSHSLGGTTVYIALRTESLRLCHSLSVVDTLHTVSFAAGHCTAIHTIAHLNTAA